LLEHPNIVPVYDIGVGDDQLPYFTMKNLGGENLQAILDEMCRGNKSYQEKYSLGDLLEIFIKICDAVSYAHSEGIVHLDLKPANIQVDEYGQVQVCD